MMKVHQYFFLKHSERVILLRILYRIIYWEFILKFIPRCKAYRFIFRSKPLHQPSPGQPRDKLRQHLKLLYILYRNLPWKPTCLRLALALRDSLAAEGIGSSIRIGMQHNMQEFHAHAWLECCGLNVLQNGVHHQLTTIGKETFYGSS